MIGREDRVVSYPTVGVAWAGVGVLFLVYASSFVDRQIMSLLVMPIREDLAITDTQFSILNGFAFALFYASLGIPIGRLVDHRDRRWVLSAGIALWSIFTVLCGRAASFGALFLARLGVGVGEATVAPGTYSLLADYFPPERLGVPMGIFGAGVYVGTGLAFGIGGLVVAWLQNVHTAVGPLAHLSAWQMAFVVVGTPGLLLAGLLLLLWEPRTGAERRYHPPTQTNSQSLRSHWRGGLAGIGTHHLATSFMAMALYAVVAWSPEYFRRAFGMDAMTSGVRIGLVVGLCGTCGVVGAGVLSDWLVRHGVRAARLKVLAAASATACPSLWLFPMMQQPDSALAWLGISVLLLAALTSCGPLGVQELYPPHLRGRGAATFQLMVTLIGLGVGPTVVAVVSDHLVLSTHVLGRALSMTTPAMVGVACAAAMFGLRSYAVATDRAKSSD